MIFFNKRYEEICLLELLKTADSGQFSVNICEPWFMKWHQSALRAACRDDRRLLLYSGCLVA